MCLLAQAFASGRDGIVRVAVMSSESANPQDAVAHQLKAVRDAVRVKRDANPMDEFSDNGALTMRLFWHLFLLQRDASVLRDRSDSDGSEQHERGDRQEQLAAEGTEDNDDGSQEQLAAEGTEGNEDGSDQHEQGDRQEQLAEGTEGNESIAASQK